MPNVFEENFLENLSFKHTVHKTGYVPFVETEYGKGNAPEICGDLFTHKGGALYIPCDEHFRFIQDYDKKEKRSTADAFYLDYDFSGAKAVTAYQEPGEKKHLHIDALTFGPDLSIPHNLQSHLVYLRHYWDLRHQERERNEVLLNDLSLQGFTLPPVIAGSSIHTYSEGYEGETLYIQTNYGWRSFLVNGDYKKPDGRLKEGLMHKWYETYEGIIEPYRGYLGAFKGAQSLHLPVSEDVLNKIRMYYVDDHLSSTPSIEAPYSLNLYGRHNPSLFQLAALITTDKLDNKRTHGVLVSAKHDDFTSTSWSETCYFVPYTRKQNEHGIIQITAHPSQTLKMAFESWGKLKSAEPANPPEEVQKLLETYFTRPEPRWDSPLIKTVSKDPQ